MPSPNEFRSFYQAHFPFAWRVLRRLGASDDELPDLLQEVFLIAYRKLPEFEGRARTTTWVFSICQNVLRSARRRSKQRRAEEQGVPPATVAPSEEDALSVRQLLRQLPEEQSVVFVLFELEGMSGQEIARTLSIPVGTVRSRLRLARESFRRTLAAAKKSPTEAGGRHA